MLTKKACAVAAALTVLMAQAHAANVTASMTIAQSDGSTWAESLTGLVVIDAQNNFSMVQGGATTGYFQNGSFVSVADVAAHPDYWQWNAGTSAWNWHTAQTLSGSTPATITNPNDPWQSAVSLQNLAGHGDPDMIYAVSAINNNTLSQTYTFTFGEAIAPIVSGPNTTYADVSGALTSRAGGAATISPLNPGGVQQFELSADNGASFVNAGVDVGQSATTSGTSAYGVYSATNPNGPTGQSWNYMRLVSSFTLSAKTAGSLTGFASISPVPEPQSEAMLLAGVGLIGTIMRRRRIIWK